MDLAKKNTDAFHVVLSYGDIYRQSGYRTRVLSELNAYDRRTAPKSALLVFDRDWRKLANLELDSVQVYAHSRRGAPNYYLDLLSLSRKAPVKLVHAHNLYSGALALSGRKTFGYRVVLDLHGRIPEEYLLRKKGGALAYRILNRLESSVIRSSDHIITVSHKLKEYLIDRYSAPAAGVTVIPMCADPTAFRWDPDLRARTRAELGLQDRFVCVHLGSFFDWYEPEWIVRAFERIRRYAASSHLLVVTGDAARAADYLSARLPAETFTVTSAPHAEVPRFLAASDLGFLLLRPTPNIRVSSPSKFAEYLNAGLPVLITPHVGDFSFLTEAHGIGAVVSEDGEFDVSIVDAISRSRESFAQRAMEAGRGLTWDAWRSSWESIVRSLQTPLLG